LKAEIQHLHKPQRERKTESKNPQLRYITTVHNMYQIKALK